MVGEHSDDGLQRDPGQNDSVNAGHDANNVTETATFSRDDIPAEWLETAKRLSHPITTQDTITALDVPAHYVQAVSRMLLGSSETDYVFSPDAHDVDMRIVSRDTEGNEGNRSVELSHGDQAVEYSFHNNRGGEVLYLSGNFGRSLLGDFKAPVNKLWYNNGRLTNIEFPQYTFIRANEEKVYQKTGDMLSARVPLDADFFINQKTGGSSYRYGKPKFHMQNPSVTMLYDDYDSTGTPQFIYWLGMDAGRNSLYDGDERPAPRIIIAQYDPENKMLRKVTAAVSFDQAAAKERAGSETRLDGDYRNRSWRDLPEIIPISFSIREMDESTELSDIDELAGKDLSDDASFPETRGAKTSVSESSSTQVAVLPQDAGEQDTSTPESVPAPEPHAQGRIAAIRDRLRRLKRRF